MSQVSLKSPVGINGIGRIGKLLVWCLSAYKKQDEIVISTGREVGRSIKDLAAYFQYDSTYGNYEKFLFGYKSENRVEIKDSTLFLNGVKITWLSQSEYRVPGKIPWCDYGVEVVFDTTGQMVDPSVSDDNSLRGHLNNSKKVILTAPFKVKNKGSLMPEDSITLVGGVNYQDYDETGHNIISNASCTTNCCAPPIKALVDHFGDKMISYALTTVHAATNSQSVLDSLAKSGDKDTRKRRSSLNNLIPTTTGAANAVLEVIPEIRDLGIGSQASSLRVPVNTGSIVIMNISVLGEFDNEYIQDIFRKYTEKNSDIMKFSEEQLVSSDIVGSTHSSIYDSLFTHHRTSKRDDRYYTMFDLNFWYDNEFAYVNSLLRTYELITGRR